MPCPAFGTDTSTDASNTSRYSRVTAHGMKSHVPRMIRVGTSARRSTGRGSAIFAKSAYIVMELVTGGTLQQRIEAGALPVKVAMRVCAEVAAALTAAHANGLVHRDIKPANIMVAPAGVKVVDFGIAAAISPHGAGDPDGELLGTPTYLAPERLTGDAVEPATDIYALGVLLYQLLAGHGPWSADTVTQMLLAHVYTEPDPLPRLPDVPDQVTDLCHRCLRKDPTQRPTARQVAAILADAAGVKIVDDDLAHVLSPPADDGEPSPVLLRSPATAPPEPVSTTAARHRRRRVRVATAALTATAVALLLALFLPTGSQPQQPSQAATQPQLTGPSEPAVATARPTAGAGTTTPGAGGPSDHTGALSSGPPGTTNTPTAGPDPGGPAPAPPTPTTAAPPAPQQRTLTSAGGTVRATCTPSGSAQLLSWTPTKPYKLEHIDPGPAPATVAAFRHGNDIVQMTVTCTGGVPLPASAPPENSHPLPHDSSFAQPAVLPAQALPLQMRPDRYGQPRQRPARLVTSEARASPHPRRSTGANNRHADPVVQRVADGIRRAATPPFAASLGTQLVNIIDLTSARRTSRSAGQRAGHAFWFSGLMASLGLFAIIVVPSSSVRGIGICGPVDPVDRHAGRVDAAPGRALWMAPVSRGAGSLRVVLMCRLVVVGRAGPGGGPR